MRTGAHEMARARRLLLAAAVAAAAALLAGCAELKDDLPAATDPAISVHPDGWTDPSAAGFHGASVAAAGWDMRSCRTCHGSDYAGGTAQVSCRTCHAAAGGPENCTTCHGGPNSPAPPEDLGGNSSTASAGVGAHAKHVLGGNLASKTWCYECHTVPASVYNAGHVDSDLPAEVPMNGPLARTASDGVAPIPVHDYGTLTCSNTYCHGNWKLDRSSSPYQFAFRDTAMTGSNRSPVWTGGAPEAACGTCHFSVPDPPAAPDSIMFVPAGHFPQPNASCVNCHWDVVDGAGKIADKTLHINGKINVFGGERSF